MKFQKQKRFLWMALALAVCMLLAVSAGNLTANAASSGTKKISGITYKVTNSKKKTATVSTSTKSIKTAKIAASVKINGKTYKVTGIAKNAFKNRKTLKSVTIGKNVKTISANAFYGCKALSSVTINTNSLTQIGSNGFKGIKNSAKFYVPKAKYNKYQKLIKNKKTGWKSTMKVLKNGNSSENPISEAEKYEYSVTPLTDNICSYFYVKTDNPDPESFDFIDKDTSLTESGTGYISICKVKFADVEYTKKAAWRVNGGYIFSGITDGGKLTLETITNGKKQITKKTVTIPKLKSSTGYLIDTYTTDSMSFFEKMDAVQGGLINLALYKGAWVRGKLYRSDVSPYYGLNTSPHVDQSFIITSPYLQTDIEPLLMSELYPYELDSYFFPLKMAEVAKTLDASATWRWNSGLHYQIDVTYHGEKKIYGGAGMLGTGQGITKDMIKYKYLFDGSSCDAFTKRSWKDMLAIIREYGKMTVKDDEKDLPALTLGDVAKTVGSDGGYARVRLVTSLYIPSKAFGFSFFYTKNGGLEYMSDVWYDGRFFNDHEFFEKGTAFEDEPDADIIIKDVKIPFPQETDEKEYFYNGMPIEEETAYNPVTGVWSGFMKFCYDEYSDTWIASIYDETLCRDKDTREFLRIEDEVFVDACVLTFDEVKNMQIDKNANSYPESFYRYDQLVPPGTKGTLSDIR